MSSSHVAGRLVALQRRSELARLGRLLNSGVARVSLLTAALVVGAVLSTGAVMSLPERAAPYHVPWWVLAGLFCAAEICVVHVQFRREAQSFSLSEVPLVIGLFFDRPLTVVLACLLGVAVALVVHRRQSRLKLAFNLGNFVLGAVVAICLFMRVAPEAGAVGNPALLAALASVLLAGAVQSAVFVVALFLSEGRVDRSGLAANCGLAMLGTAINGCLALITVTVMWFHPEVVWLLLVPAAGVALAYRSYVSERENRQQVAFLYESSRQLQHASDLDQALIEVLRGLRETFRVEMAEVIIFPTRAGEVMVRAGVGADGVAPMAPMEGGEDEQRFVTGMVTTAPAILDPERAADPDARRFLARQGLRNGMIAVLRGETRPIGLMVAGNRLGDVSSFGEEDLRLFQMLAAHTGSTLENGRLESSLRQLTDLQHKLRHQALHDPLTGMGNRSLFQSSVRDALADGAERVGVLFIDLDDFKTVNDSLGHVVGDELLRAVAGRVSECLRPGDLAARLGGDEFAVLLQGIADSRAATAVASRIVERLREPFQVMGADIMVRASIGIATGVSGEQDGDELLRNADEAMYTAKGLGKGRWEVFAPSMHAAVLSRHEFKADLHRALERDELVLHYQPMFEIPSGDVVAAEALLRWRHPRHGLVQPASFIPLAEETGLIAPIGAWVMERSCAEAVRWHEAHPTREISVAVNVSPRQLQRAQFADELTTILARTGLSARSLILEVTESLAVEEAEGATGRLQHLRELGIRIAIDDFGTGHSSLSRLRAFPVDILKIDKAFTTTLAPGQDVGGLSRAVFAFSHSLGVTVVAEGVERLDHLRALDGLPTQWAQGFHLAPPLTAAAMLELVREGGRADRLPVDSQVLQLPLRSRAG
jgi:diguanylate cyclase (GGDEF)-like protein